MELLKGKGVKGFFTKQKDDPQFLERQKRARNSLLKNLSKAVKEVQLLFTRSETGEVGDCRAVQRLCARFEDVLRHELKPTWTGKTPTFWPVVLKISRKQAIEYINKLQYAQSENGRCRAWIRTAVNECSLESYINVLCQDTQVLNQYYEAHSFLREEETVIAMKQLLAGLSQVSFKITVDTASLEFAPAPEVLQPPLRIKAPLPIENASQSSGPSSTSTPQASSSEESWQSNSSSSSSNVHNESNGAIKHSKSKTDTKDKVIVKMSEGLEVSVHQDEESIVIEAPGLAKVNAYSNLKRFSMALEDTNDDWLTHDDYDATRRVDDQEEEEGMRMMSGSVSEGGIYMSVTDNSPLMTHQEVTTQDDCSPGSHKSSTHNGHLQSPTDSPRTSPAPSKANNDISEGLKSSPLYSEKSPSPYKTPPDSPLKTPDSPFKTPDSPFKTPDLSPFKTPPDSSTYKTPHDSFLHKTPDSPHRTPDSPHRTPDSPHRTPDSPHRTPDSPHKTPDSPPRKILDSPINDYVQDECSFTEILRLAAGVKPKSLINDEPPPPQVQSNSNAYSDPYVDPSIGYQAATPKAESNIDNMFSSTSPDTPVAKHMNPFMDEYEGSPEPPSDPSVTIATHRNPFDDPLDEFGSNNEASNTERSNNETFGSYLIDKPHQSLNPFDDPIPHTDDIVPSSEYSSTNPRYTVSDLSVNVDFAKMVIKEDHYGHEMSIEEIEVKISKLKTYVKRDSNNVDLQQALVKLQLLKRTKLDAMEDESMIEGGEVVFGHTFQEVRLKITGKKCDVCNKALMLKKLYQCASCGQVIHEKCLNSITRKCVSHALKDHTTYSMEIRPEKGLTHQHFRCDRCNTALNGTSVEVRLCDYTGLYYCSDCHHNNLSLIPARILRNWDFDQRTVCCGCAEILSAMETRPLINIRLINPSLYKFISDIPEVESLRKDLLLMKSLLVECDRAKEEKLIQELDQWPHFKDTAYMYSICDMIGLHNGTLLTQLQVVHKLFFSHVHQECETCLNHGKVCCICQSPEKLFKFTKNTVNCQKCLAIFHKSCSPNSSKCPVCTKQRKSIF